jgi:hypothetical protein
LARDARDYQEDYYLVAKINVRYMRCFFKIRMAPFLTPSFHFQQGEKAGNHKQNKGRKREKEK